MIPLPKPAPDTAAEARHADLLQPLWVVAALLLPLLAYLGTAQSIVAIWQRSETFAHGYVIVPISLWLVWRRRAVLAQLPLQPCWPALALLALCGAGWLLADFGDVLVVRQLALATMLPLTVLAVLGRPIALALAFPLAFLLLGVPFGESLVAPLMDVTANFTVDALRLTGIPVWREGNSFSIPSGSWSVVEACSGVRYLISSFTLGSLYAYLTYRSLRRRAVFIVLAIIVPIVANGMRAYLIVMIGHLSGMSMAVGVDHLIYGWLFFGLVMFLLFWIGSFWREDRHDEPQPPAHTHVRHAPLGRMAAAMLAAALCVGVWPAYAAYLSAQIGQAGQARAPQLAAWPAAWPATAAFTEWQPHFTPARAELRQFYQRDDQVGLALRYYRNQDEVSKLVSSVNQLISGAQGDGWHILSSAVRTETLAGRPLKLRESLLANSQSSQRLVVWQWYWIDGHTTTSDYLGKLYQARQKIVSGRDDGAAVFVFARYEEQADSARRSLHAFLDANLVPMEAMLANTK